MSQRKPTEEAYAELQQAYDFYNDKLYDGRLPDCMITFQREKKTMGYFSAGRFVRVNGVKSDEIAMNPEYFALYPMVEVLQTLVHEMAHMWQHHFGNPTRACYHNKEWAAKLEAIGLMPSSTGAPGGKKTGQKMADYVLRGGRFELVTRELLARGFAISWLDRFPAAQKGQAVAAWASGGSPSIMPEDALGEAVSASEGAYEAAIATPAAERLQGLDLQVRPAGENRSNRIKYVCPGCSVGVWGKPKLRISCDDCELSLVDHELMAHRDAEEVGAD